MPDLPQPTTGRVGEVDWTLRPEWLAGRYWWRVVVAGHPKLLMRDHELAVQAAEAVAADEHRFRREAADAGQ
jgi:hypothetical protein